MKIIAYILACVAWALGVAITWLTKDTTKPPSKKKATKSPMEDHEENVGCSRHDDPAICKMWTKMFRRMVTLDSEFEKFVKADTKIMKEWENLDLDERKEKLESTRKLVVAWSEALLKACKLHSKLKKKAVETEDVQDILKLEELRDYLGTHRDKIAVVAALKGAINKGLEQEDEELDPFKAPDLDDSLGNHSMDDLMDELGLN